MSVPEAPVALTRAGVVNVLEKARPVLFSGYSAGGADFIALDLTTPNMQPVYHIVSNIVYAASGLENRLTVVDGRELYRDGKFLTCDYDALCREIKERAAFFA